MSLFARHFNRIGPLNRLFICIIILNVVYALILSIAGCYPNSFTHFKWLVYDETVYNDSWTTMIAALHHFVESPDESIYQSLLIDKGTKFQYPPSSLLIFDLPARIGIRDYQMIKVLDILSLIGFLLIALVTTKLVQAVCARYSFMQLGVAATGYAAISYVLVFLLTFLFYPLVWSYHVGQIQTLLTLFTTLAIFCWVTEKKQLAGIMIGLICLVKPQLGLLFVWAIIRRQWQFVIAGCIAIAPILALSIGFYGFENHVDYLSALSYLSRHGESYYPNQSVNGLMNRALFNGDNLLWNDDGFPPFSFPVYITTLLSSLVLLGFGLLWNRKIKTPPVIDFALMILCTTMASPIAWEHHYGVLLPIGVMVAPFVYHYYHRRRAILVLFMMALVVASQFLEPVNRLSHTGLNFLQSYLFFSALIILGFLVSVSRRQPKPSDTATA